MKRLFTYFYEKKGDLGRELMEMLDA